MTRVVPRLGPAAPLVAAVGVPTCAAIVLAPGNALLAAAPSALAAAVLALGRIRLRVLALALVGLVVALEEPLAFGGLWQPPSFALSELIFRNLKHTLGIEALSVSPLDLAIGLLAAKAALDWLTGRRSDEAGAVPAAPAVGIAALVSLGGLLLAEAWGLAHGGSFRMSLWQVRQPLALPLLTLLLLSTLRGPRDHRALAAVLLGGAALRASLGLYFAFAVKGPQGLDLAYITTHDDTVIFVGATVLALLLAVEEVEPRVRRVALATLPLIGLAILLNNRRIAYVELLACAGLGLWLLPAGSRLRRKAARAALVGLPLLALYVGLGLKIDSPVFAPVRALTTVGAETDASSAWRDDENRFLVMTLRQSPSLGTGFGREYLDPDPNHVNMASIFAEYRYLPHNSILGLWAFTGAAFAAIWLPMAVGLFLAARSVLHAQAPAHRIAALTCVSVLVAYVLQAWADIGLQSWLATFLAAGALAVSARLAVVTGAWPVGGERPSA